MLAGIRTLAGICMLAGIRTLAGICTLTGIVVLTGLMGPSSDKNSRRAYDPVTG